MSLLKRIERERAATSDRSSGTTQMRVRRQPAVPARDAYLDLKTRIQNKLIADLDPTMDVGRSDEVRRTIEDMYNTLLAEEQVVLSRAERQRLFEQIVAEILGLGPLEPYLADPTITEVMVNGAKSIYIEAEGKIHRVNAVFESDEHLMRIIERIVAPLGRRIDEASPYVDARLQDGSRVNAVIPPISLVGPVLTIRKFFKIPLTWQSQNPRGFDLP